MASNKTAIVTGASQGIGQAVVRAFLDRDYNVVGNARHFRGEDFKPLPKLALVEGDIGVASTAKEIARTAVEKFGSIDHVVTSAGIFSSKPFTDYTVDEFCGFGRCLLFIVGHRRWVGPAGRGRAVCYSGYFFEIVS